MSYGPYIAALRAQSVGASTEDGNGHRLERTPDGWKFTEPSEDAPGYGVYMLDEVQAADVLYSIFPGSFDSPERN
jgi:hypothetical protein